MAQLKDSIVSGNLRVSDTTLSTTVQLTTLRAPTTSGGTTYGPGTSGQVLKSNGTTSYWAADSNTDTKVNITLATTTKAYILGTATTPTSSAQAVESLGDTGVFLTTTAGRLQAGTYAITSGSYAHILKPGSTNLSANAEHTFPNTGGTVLNTGTTSYTADANAPTSSTTGAYAIGTLKINGSSYSIYGKDTNTWTAMTGATSSANGSVGYINSTPPKDGYNTKFWRADGSWAVPTNTDTKVNVKLATTTKAYLLATSTTPTSSDQAVTSLADTGVYLSTTAGEIVATNFSGKINNHTVGADVPATAVFTDEKVKQTATSTSDFRPVVFGTTHSTTPGDLAPSTAPVDQVYVTPSFYMQPSTGKLYTKSKIYFDNATFDTSTTPATVTTEAAGLYAYDETGYRYQLIIENTHNLWIGAGQTTGQHHTGETYISAGYDKDNSVGFSTIKISVPNATNDGATNYSVWHSGNLTPYSHPTYTAQSTAAIYAITRDATGHIGSIATPSAAQVSTIINQLSEGTSNPQLADYYVSQYAGGGSTTKTYHRRPISALWNTLRALITATTTGSGNAITSVSLADDGNNRKFTFTKGTTFSTTDENVKQTATSTDANYEVLFSNTADNTTRTEGARKNSNLTFNPSSGTLFATNFVGTVNSYSIGASVPSAAVFTDENVTQTELALDASYEVLFAGTADSTTRTEGAGKSSAVTLNPSSGNLTTTGAFILKEGSYTGTITQNTLNANRTWTFPKHVSGIVHIEQRANFYDDTAGVASTPWQKVASLTTGAASTDRTATFIVAANYSGDVDKKFGIVQCHLRTNGSKVFSSAELTWLYKSPQLFLSDIVLLYKSVANTNTTIEIWAKSIRRYSGYTFTLLDEHDRKGVISGQWELTTNNGAAGSASLPTGFTSKDSRILSDGTLLATETYSGSDNTHTITNTDYDWDSFSLILLHIKTGTTSGLGDNYITIPIPWKDFNDYFDSQTTYNNNGYIPYGLSQYSSGIFLMGNHHQGFSIAIGTGSWVSSKTIKVIGIV